MERDNPLDDLTTTSCWRSSRASIRLRRRRDFTARTMRAVVRAPLPAGRKALRDPLASMFGWAAVIAAVAFAVLAIALSQPIVTASFSRLITRGVGTGVWLMQFGQMGLQIAGRADDDRSRGVASGRDG